MGMVELRETRPETSANFVTFTNGMAKRNCDAFATWITEHEIKRSQIISITMNETEIEEGDQMLTVFYRKKPIAEQELVFEDLKYEHFNQNHSWTRLQKEADSKLRGVDVISLQQSPKNIGSSQNQFMWYVKGSNTAGTAGQKLLRREDGNWNELITEVKDWMNNYVAPHQLISVSLYEDAHENVDKGINACIVHTAGASPKQLTENEGVKDGNIYDVQVIMGAEEWENMFESAAKQINKKGGQEGHLVTSTNNSGNDGGVVVVFSWTSLMERGLREAIRPATCMEQCTIF